MGRNDPGAPNHGALLPYLGREGLHGQEKAQADALTETVHPVGLDRVFRQVLRPLVRVGTTDHGVIEFVHQKGHMDHLQYEVSSMLIIMC